MKIEIKNDKMQILTPSEEDNFLTNYKDGENIINYNSTKQVIAPLNLNVEEMYREITAEANKAYIEEMELRIKELEDIDDAIDKE